MTIKGGLKLWLFVALLLCSSNNVYAQSQFESDPPGASATLISGRLRVPLGPCGKPFTLSVDGSRVCVLSQHDGTGETHEVVDPGARNLRDVTGVYVQFDAGPDYESASPRWYAWDGRLLRFKDGQDMHVQLAALTWKGRLAWAWSHHRPGVILTVLACGAALCALSVLRRRQPRAATARRTASSAESLEGVMFGSWQLVERIGSGGFAVVYRARQTRDRNQPDRAVKVIRDRVDREWLEREYKMAHDLDHPALQKVYELRDVDGYPALSVELVQGRSLRHRLNVGPLPVDEALALARHVLKGAWAAHRAGVVHHDLKPENILCTPGGVKIIDFGLATSSSSEDDTAMTLEFAGSAGYLAPELAAGQPGGAAADQFALGVIFFEMLAGRRPFEGDNPAALLARPLSEGPPSLRAWRPEVTDALERAIQRMLAPDPRNRFVDLAAALDALP